MRKTRRARRFAGRDGAMSSKFSFEYEVLEPRTLLAVLGLGDVAFTGYQSTTTDKVSLVLLKSVDAGTTLTITDNGWSGSLLSTNEGTSVVSFNGTFAAGTQINFDASRTAGARWAVGSVTTNISDVTSTSFALSATGDNLFAYNGSLAPTTGTSTSWVAAFATNAFQTSGAANTNQTYLPAIFSGTNSQLTLNLTVGANNQNGAYTGGSFTGTEIQVRSAVHNIASWTSFATAGGQAIPPAATFTIGGGSGNQAPTGLNLSGSSLPENAAPNATIGLLSSIDPNPGDTFTYSLVSGLGSTDNHRFNINSAQLRATTSFDFESQTTYNIRVRTTDQGGLWFERSFQIQATDVADGAPTNLRIVNYNIAAVDGVRSGLNTILQAIGNEAVAGIARPIDLLALQEIDTQATTTASVVTLLNSIYGGTNYARGVLNAVSTGSGTLGVVYNSQTLQLLGEVAIGTASASGQPRQGVRYHFRPVGHGTTNDFYVYNSHWKSENDTESASRRLIEAQAIRANADALGNGRNILYMGDFNTYTGSEASFQALLASGNGQGSDPLNRVGSWSNSSTFRDIMTQAPAVNPPAGLVGGGLDDRFDFQIVSGELRDGTGLDYRTGSYRTFGNNGSVVLNGNINDSNTTALPGLVNRTTVLALLTTVSDHLPVVADYSLPSTYLNQAPMGGDSRVTASSNVPYTFSLADFKFSDPNNSPGNGFESVRISKLPSVGVLTLSGSPVTIGQFVPASQIAAGNFRFLSPAHRWGYPLTSFAFQVRDNGGTANGGVNLDSEPNIISINVNLSRSRTDFGSAPSRSSDAGVSTGLGTSSSSRQIQTDEDSLFKRTSFFNQELIRSNGVVLIGGNASSIFSEKSIAMRSSHRHEINRDKLEDRLNDGRYLALAPADQLAAIDDAFAAFI